MLGGILDGGEAYGWEISKVLSERGGLIAGEGGTLYPLLNRLHREGVGVHALAAKREWSPAKVLRADWRGGTRD